jgi:hypothetical protein
MGNKKITTIQISEPTVKKLRRLQAYPKETYENIILRKIEG